MSAIPFKTWTLAEQQDLVNNLAGVFGWHPVPVLSWPEAAAVPFMVAYGVECIESPEKASCSGCLFQERDCADAWDEAPKVFGGDCADRNVIYIKRGEA